MKRDKEAEKAEAKGGPKLKKTARTSIFITIVGVKRKADTTICVTGETDGTASNSTNQLRTRKA